MKKMIFVLAAFFLAAPAMAAGQLVASCKITPVNQEGYWESGKVIGSLQISLSDNGDEGFLTFVVQGPDRDDAGNKREVAGWLKDNVQDDGAAFLTNGNSRLYIPYRTSYSRPSAVYLENKEGVISGLIKLGFFSGTLTSCVAENE